MSGHCQPPRPEACDTCAHLTGHLNATAYREANGIPHAFVSPPVFEYQEHCKCIACAGVRAKAAL